MPSVWADITNAMRGFKDHSLHMLVLDEVLVLELSNFSRQLKLKLEINDNHRMIMAMSDDLWFRGSEITEELRRDESSLGSGGLANKTRGQQMAELDSSDSCIGH